MQYVLVQKQGCSPDTSLRSVSPQIIPITPAARLTEVQTEDLCFCLENRNHVSNLRNKLKVTSETPDYIRSVHSIGCKFNPNIEILSSTKKRVFKKKYSSAYRCKISFCNVKATREIIIKDTIIIIIVP